MTPLADWLAIAESATFVFEDGSWRFCYLTTQDGKVLGSMEAFESTMEAYNSTLKGPVRLALSEDRSLRLEDGAGDPVRRDKT